MVVTTASDKASYFCLCSSCRLFIFLFPRYNNVAAVAARPIGPINFVNPTVTLDRDPTMPDLDARPPLPTAVSIADAAIPLRFVKSSIADACVSSCVTLINPKSKPEYFITCCDKSPIFPPAIDPIAAIDVSAKVPDISALFIPFKFLLLCFTCLSCSPFAPPNPYAPSMPPVTDMLADKSFSLLSLFLLIDLSIADTGPVVP